MIKLLFIPAPALHPSVRAPHLHLGVAPEEPAGVQLAAGGGRLTVALVLHKGVPAVLQEASVTGDEKGPLVNAIQLIQYIRTFFKRVSRTGIH